MVADRIAAGEQHALAYLGVSTMTAAVNTKHLSDVRRRDRRDRQGWCILRTNGRRTLALVKSLNAVNIEAWSPHHVVKRRTARHKPMREHDEPITPSFVFVRASCLEDVMRALALPNSPHPSFSIFQHAGRAPVIADLEMGHLRHIETQARLAHEAEKERASRAARRALRRDVSIGSIVRLSEGAYAGLSGVVEEASPNQAVVCFNGMWRVAVASWLFVGAEVHEANIEGRQDRQAGVSADDSRRIGHRAAA